MFHRLRAQVRQLADHFSDKPVEPVSARPSLSGLEQRDLMASLVPGNLLNVWYDGAYAEATPDVPAATVGVSQIDPTTGVEQTLAKLPVGAAVEAGLADGVNGVTASGGAVFFATSRAGGYAWGGNTPARDDSSSIVRVEPATGKATTLATFGRESRGLTTAPDGSLVNVWYDGEYTPNSLYGPASAAVGVSRVDLVTGAETVLYRGPADVTGWTNPMAATVRGAAVVGGGVFYTTTRSGRPGWPGQAPTDDRSTIVRVDLATGKATTLATFGRESRGLAAGADGSLVNAWYDGEYTSNSLYGPESATVGVSRVDPATGAETVLSSQPPTAWAYGFVLNAVAAVGGAVVVAESRPGSSGVPFFHAPQDDATTLWRVGGGPSDLLASFPRESRGLATVTAAAATPPVVPPVTPPAPPKPPTPAPTSAATVTRVYPVSATEGAKFAATLAAVKLPPGPAYRVTVFWGDGRTAAGTLTSTGAGASTVSAAHTYDTPGSYAVTVRVTADARTVLSIDAKATVADARFYAGRVAQRVNAGVAFDGVVATVTDFNRAGGRATDYTATIDWGDGRTSAGRVRQAAPGKFEVLGGATFAAAGRRTVTVTIRSNGGGTATAVSIFVIDPLARR